MRRKGHNFERNVAKKFRELGYRARTTRSASVLLDSCGVDIVGTPFIIQCKSGYAKARPKFEVEYNYIKKRIEEEFGENHPILNNFPIIIIHELDVGRGHSRTKDDTYVMVSLEDFIKILTGDNTSTLDIL